MIPDTFCHIFKILRKIQHLRYFLFNCRLKGQIGSMLGMSYIISIQTVRIHTPVKTMQLLTLFRYLLFNGIYKGQNGIMLRMSYIISIKNTYTQQSYFLL